jgi:hypothetical protein
VQSRWLGFVSVIVHILDFCLTEYMESGCDKASSCDPGDTAQKGKGRRRDAQWLQSHIRFLQKSEQVKDLAAQVLPLSLSLRSRLRGIPGHGMFLCSATKPHVSATTGKRHPCLATR